MSLASLIVIPNNPPGQAAFWFENDQAHRTLLAAMPPLDRFSVAPYVLDPMQNTGGWFLDHQTAHNDFRTQLPVLWGWWQIALQQYGVANAQTLLDADLNNFEQRKWWEFINHQDHKIAAQLME